MEREAIRYDDNGNFLLDGELEKQWMKLHRDIQAEYRQEQWGAFLKGTAVVGIVLAAGYVLISAVTLWMY